MMKTLNETFDLLDGHAIPKIGFGTWQAKDGAEQRML